MQRRAAAAQLGVTESATSHSIRQLEGHLGVRLLHRMSTVSSTESGIRRLEGLSIFGARSKNGSPIGSPRALQLINCPRVRMLHRLPRT
jgi:DNA-binding transcriptional LysR family regulator